MPSFSGIFTWETMLSSNQRIDMGILAPHLSHTAVIPHFTAIAPLRLESRAMTPGFASMIRELMGSLSSSASALNILSWEVLYRAAVEGEDDLGPLKMSFWRR